MFLISKVCKGWGWGAVVGLQMSKVLQMLGPSEQLQDCSVPAHPLPT